MNHEEQMQLLTARHEAELLRIENTHLKAMLTDAQAYAKILERGIEGTRANLASAHDACPVRINRILTGQALQHYIGELERQVEQARQVGPRGLPAELEKDWPQMPDPYRTGLDGIDRFADECGPPTGNEEETT